MDKVYVVTFKHTPYSTTHSQIIGATTDADKIFDIINTHVSTISDNLDDDDRTALAYLTDPNQKWYVDDLAVGQVRLSGKGHFSVEIAVTLLM